MLREMSNDVATMVFVSPTIWYNIRSKIVRELSLIESECCSIQFFGLFTGSDDE